MKQLVRTARFQTLTRQINYLIQTYAKQFGENSTMLNDLQADIMGSNIPEENLKFDNNGNLKIIKPFQLSQKIDLEELQNIKNKNKTYGDLRRKYEEDYERAKEKGQTNKTIGEYIETMHASNKIDDDLTTIYDYMNSDSKDKDENLLLECDRIINVFHQEHKTDTDIDDLFRIASLVKSR